MKRYLKSKSARHRKSTNETNDCSVIAMSIVARMTYKAAHAELQRFGRVNGKGFNNISILLAIEAQGFKVEPIKKTRQSNGSKYTPKTIGDKLKRGYFVCFCNNHIFAVVNGDVEDWTHGRQHHINDMWKITREKVSC